LFRACRSTKLYELQYWICNKEANPRGSKLKLGHKRAVDLLLVLIRDDRTVLSTEEDTHGMKRLLDVGLVVQNHLLDIMIKV
jgi:hypothetical protein